jgi:hypothetical protein
MSASIFNYCHAVGGLTAHSRAFALAGAVRGGNVLMSRLERRNRLAIKAPASRAGWLARRDRIAMAAVILCAVWSANGLQSTRAGSLLPAYFEPNAAAPLAPLMVMELAPPPVDPQENKSEYAYGPVTDSVSQNVDAQNDSTWTGRNWAMVWANRARVPAGGPPLRPNPITPAIVDGQGHNCATEFSTVARANAATQAQVLYILGAPPSVWQAPLKAAGVTALTWDQLNAHPDTYFTTWSQDGSSKVTVDKMVVPQAVSTSASGIEIDYEVQDGRPPFEGEGLLVNLGAAIRSYGLKAYLYTNPWESDETPLNGFTLAGMNQIKANFDYISLFVWGGQNQCEINSAGFDQAITFLKSTSGTLNYGQFVLTIDLLNCSKLDALAIYNHMKVNHFAGYMLWPDGAIMGGTELTGANLTIWTLLNG